MTRPPAPQPPIGGWRFRRRALSVTGAMAPYSVVEPSEQVVGIAAYCDVDHVDLRLEIGYTRYAARVQRGQLSRHPRLQHH